MIYVIATIEIADGRREQFLDEVRKIVPAVRKEVGCIEYGPAIDLETNIDAQPAARSNVVTMIEKWEDLKALQAHLIAPHMVDYRTKVKGLVSQLTLQVFQPV